MEPDIILEDFRLAEHQHSVRYTKFIGDGDSSVHTQLISNVSGWDMPYRSKNVPTML